MKTLAPLREVEEQESLIEALRRELAELREENRRFRDLAYLDCLTGLRNRRYFEERLSQELARAGRSKGTLAVLLIDLDDFKRINDRAGHARGDEVLAWLGRFLETNVRSSDVPCRLGGDEFAIILPDTDASGAGVVASRLLDQLERAHDVPELPRPLGVHLSLGWAASPEQATTPRDLISAADEAMYRNKRQRKRAVESRVIAAA